MQQKASGQFRGSPVGGLVQVNLADLGNQVGWQAGATLIDLLTVSPLLSQRYSILNYTITFQGSYFTGNTSPAYGRLPRILGGLVRSPQTTQGTALDDNGQKVPYTTGMQQLPSDTSLVSTLWDGTVDPMFPGPKTVEPTIPTTVTTSLPLPLAIDPGERIGVGLWLTPGLTKNLQLFVQLATYVLTYDDGRSQ